ncbi:tyrosine recombinase xerD [Chryseobacterium sp. StRB126]|uniref:phage integrase SAM-like domain-containing protein n=1 Tax=Chryseobacterium sp. StRB126 TaxID=878220 RepID=UPI0004E995C9|nr:phage integrase SAM-like domain-containing protein [Chryseobacterium sp. StRB126]BAP32627.1 tyrosine recombinase xerD [Chryseobacterium sp. StRB126]
MNNYGNWTSTLVHLKKVIPQNLLFEEIDENFIKKVKNYIDNEAKTKSDLPLSLNSNILISINSRHL